MLYRHRVLSLLFLLSTITFLDRICISVAGPRMQEELGISPKGWGWVVATFAIAYGLFEVPGGAMADRIGARRVLARIVVWWSAFTALTGAVSSFPFLLLTRFLFGAGEAGAYPGSASSIARWFPTTSRAGAQGVVWMAARLGAAFAPLLVVPIQQAYGWRASFFLFAVLGIVWAIVWFWWYRDHPTLMPGVTQVELQDIGAAAEPPSHRALPWSRVLRNRNFWAILLMYHTYCWGGFFYLSWLHTYLQRGRGFTENEMKYLSMLPFLVGACANVTGGLLSDALSRRFGLKIGRRAVGTAGLILGGIFLLCASATPNRYVAVLCLTLGYGSMDCMAPVAWAVCLDVGKDYAGSVTGSMNMAGQAGAALSSVAFGYMAAYFGNYDTPLVPLALMLFVSAAIFMRIDPTQQLVAESDTEPSNHSDPVEPKREFESGLLSEGVTPTTKTPSR